jgi:hypothetical protein
MSRSSNNDDHEIFLEKSRLDLEQEYGGSENGRQVLNIVYSEMTPWLNQWNFDFGTRAFLEKLFKSQKGRPHPQA